MAFEAERLSGKEPEPKTQAGVAPATARVLGAIVNAHP